MATGEYQWAMSAVNPSDGSSGNATPPIRRIQGTEANPKKHFLVAAFDAATAQYLTIPLRWPVNYASGGTVLFQWMANSASANSVVWAARLGAITAADADTPVEHAAAAASTVTAAGNATEARRLMDSSITLANLDSAAVGDLAFLIVYRDAANGADTLAVEAELIIVTFQYTTT